MDMGPIRISAYNYANNIIRKSNHYMLKNQLTYDQLRGLESFIVYDTVNNKISLRNKFRFPRDTLKDDKISITYPS